MEYKDPVAEEWEKFQKSIQREDEVGSFSCFHVCKHICTFVSYFSLLICAWKVSEALLFEGDEETKEEREMVEVNEQV